MRQILFILLWTAMAAVAWASPMPQPTASHFCQLLVQTSEGRLLSLHAYVRQTPTTSDSLTLEQQFADYLFHYGGWQSLRIFPHQLPDGTVVWLSPADEELPAGLSDEHRKFIRDVLPRIAAEAEAANWSMVDAYTDRLLQYQRTFSATTPVRSSSSAFSTLLILLLFLLFFSAALIKRSAQGRSDSPAKRKQHYFLVFP